MLLPVFAVWQDAARASMNSSNFSLNSADTLTAPASRAALTRVAGLYTAKRAMGGMCHTWEDVYLFLLVI